jgi:hypothetical protein
MVGCEAVGCEAVGCEAVGDCGTSEEAVGDCATSNVLPVIKREIVSPSAVKSTFVLAVAGAVGTKRTVTSWVVPLPARVNGLPDTTLKGPEADTLPETVPPRVFCTVKTWSVKLPTLTSPKLTVPDGLTEKLSCAMALAPSAQALSTPLVFTAVTET